MSSPAVVTLRPATPDDVALLRRWQAQPHVVAAGGGDDWGWEAQLARSPAWRELLIAETGGRPLGFLQIIDPALEDSHYWGEVPLGLRALDIWIGEAEDLGQGYGTQMMELALARCFAAPDVTAVLVDPLATNAAARRFYERLGFELETRWPAGDDDSVTYRLERRVHEQARGRQPGPVGG